MKKRTAGLLAGALLGNACSALEGPDSLVAEARSPDGTRVARLWCEDFCDVAAASRLTVSASSRLIELERPHPDGYPEGDMPDDDVALRIFRNENGPGLALSWLSASNILVTGHCLTDGNFNPLATVSFRQTRIDSRDLAPARTCERPRG